MAQINLKEFAWADISIALLGRPVIKILGITYKEAQEKELLYGAGSNPLAIQRGNKSYEGSITLYQSEVIALRTAASDVPQSAGDALNASSSSLLVLPPFDITVVYANGLGGVIITDIIKLAEFTEDEVSWTQNDKFTEIEVPFIALGVNYNQ